MIKRLEAGSLATVEDRNRLLVARTKASAPPKDLRAPDFRQRRAGFQNLREHGERGGTPKETVTAAMPERRDPHRRASSPKATKFGCASSCPPSIPGGSTGCRRPARRVEAAEIGILQVVDGKLKDGLVFRRRDRPVAAARLCRRGARLASPPNMPGTKAGHVNLTGDGNDSGGRQRWPTVSRISSPGSSVKNSVGCDFLEAVHRVDADHHDPHHVNVVSSLRTVPTPSPRR